MKYPLGTTNIADVQAYFDAVEDVAQFTKFGHAMSLSVQTTQDNKFLSAQVTHYLTCKSCAESKREAQKEK